MDPSLQRLIADYQRTVALKFKQLSAEIGIEAPKTNVEWACNGIQQKGVLADGTQYFKHGFGCAFKNSDGVVDFDFGEKGEITGFNDSRLWLFAQSSRAEYGFVSQAQVAAAIIKAESQGDLKYSGYILYFINEQRT